MKITLTNAGKRFNRDWIFRHLSYQFITGHHYAITGPNGSGKSTLLQVIAGAMGANEGTIEYELTVDSRQSTDKNDPSTVNRQLSTDEKYELTVHSRQSTDKNNLSTVNRQLSTDKVYQQVAFCAPYLELIEEMTLMEFLDFHKSFKPFLRGMSSADAAKAVHLSHAAHKQIREFSSGMKQRVKLAQSILLDTPLLLLDEPCTNLDLDGIELYRQLIREYAQNRTVVVSSNDVQEYEFCGEKMDIRDFKPA